MSWSVIVCEPQREAALVEVLSESGFGAVSPTYTAWKRRHFTGSRYRSWEGERWFSRTRTLFPGYVFSTLAPEQVHYFRADGAIRVYPHNRTVMDQIARLMEGVWRSWNNAEYDDPTPPSMNRPKPIRHRNRKTKRQAEKARREAYGSLEDGMRELLRRQEEERDDLAA